MPCIWPGEQARVFHIEFECFQEGIVRKVCRLALGPALNQSANVTVTAQSTYVRPIWLLPESLPFRELLEVR